MGEKFNEADIKKAFLNNESVFGDIGDSAIVYEKAICRGHTIMDIMLCTQRKGLIGVEIKTEIDTTRRLNRQLQDYEKVCDYVYVLCHDSHVEAVDTILKRYGHAHVGIICYSAFKGQPFFGVYKVAQRSPYKKSFHTLDILWKTEIQTLLGTFAHYSRHIQEETGLKAQDTKTRQGGVGGLAIKSVYSNKMRKGQLIQELINRVGEQEATNIFCDIFINNRNHPEKSIKLTHFNPK